MEPSYWIVYGICLGTVIGVIRALGDASPILILVIVFGIWAYGGTAYEPDDGKSQLAQQVGQIAVGWDMLFQKMFEFIDEVTS